MSTFKMFVWTNTKDFFLQMFMRDLCDLCDLEIKTALSTSGYTVFIVAQLTSISLEDE